MSNFGFADLRLVNAYRLAVDEARAAVGAAAVLRETREYTGLAGAIADCSLVVGTTSAGRRELQHTLRRLEAGARLIRRHPGPVAILFGSEKYGLSNDDLSYCHWLMRIPAREEHGSMNLGQAVAVCLYELVRNPAAARKLTAPRKPAAAGEVDRFTELLLDALRESGYVNPRTAASAAEKVRRMVRRLSLTAADVTHWQGMMRQIMWKMRQVGDGR